MQVIIQSGGKGTRLSHLTKNKPKCFLTLDNKSIFHYQYENLKKYNLHKKITIIVFLYDLLYKPKFQLKLPIKAISRNQKILFQCLVQQTMNIK